MKGEEKSRIQKQCFYGPDGKVQKQQLSAPPEQAAPGGVKGKIVAKKKEEITATMKQAVALVQSYVPPDPQRIQAAKAAGNLAMVPTGPNSMRLDLRNYVKSGDTLQPRPGHRAQRDPDREREVLPRIREGRRHAGRDLRPAPRRALLPGQRRAQRAGSRRSRWWSRTRTTSGSTPGRRRRQPAARSAAAAAAAPRAERLGRGPRHPDRAHRALPGCAGRADPGGVEGRRRRAEVRRLAEDATAPSRAPRSRTPRRRPGSRLPTSRWRRSRRWSR